MKNIIYKSVLWFVMTIGGMTGMTSCNDEEVVENEWNATYVYIQRNDYLDKNNSVFNLKHSADGVVGEVAVTFKLKIQKPASQDIVGQLEFSGTGDIPLTMFALSNDKPVIKAGMTESEEITLSLTGKEELAQTEAALSGEFDIRLTGIQTENWHTVISTNPVLTIIHFTINKAEYSVQNIEKGEVDTEFTYLLDRSAWVVKAEDGVEGDVANVIDNNTGTDIAMDNNGFWITVDFGTPQKVSGVMTYHWGASYCPNKIELFVSDDGVTWKTMGTLDVSGQVHKISLIKPITTRYLKYDMLEVPSRADITEFYVYASKK